MTLSKSASKDFPRQLSGYGLTTAQILYRRPDHPWLLQTYVWQNYDLFPKFPELRRFLDAFGFDYEFRSATECYRSGVFDDTLRLVLERYEAMAEAAVEPLRLMNRAAMQIMPAALPGAPDPPPAFTPSPAPAPPDDPVVPKDALQIEFPCSDPEKKFVTGFGL